VSKFYKRIRIEAYRVDEDNKYVHSVRGDLLAKRGDWVIVEDSGGEYPCDPITFANTYERESPAPAKVSISREQIKNTIRMAIGADGMEASVTYVAEWLKLNFGVEVS
jgi:hypothetical protein